MSKKSSIKRDVLISSLPKNYQEMAFELSENFLNNELRIITQDCRLLTSTNSFILDLPIDIDSSRIMAYTIHKMLGRSELNEKYIIYDIDSETSGPLGPLEPIDSPSLSCPIKTKKIFKSKIIIIASFSALEIWKKELNLWGFSIYYMISRLGIKKIDDISEDIIIIKDCVTKYLDLDNFMGPKGPIGLNGPISYQLYLFVGENKSCKKFSDMISPYIKSKVDIADQYNYLRRTYIGYNYNSSVFEYKYSKGLIFDRYPMNTNIDIKYKIN